MVFNSQGLLCYPPPWFAITLPKDTLSPLHAAISAGQLEVVKLWPELAKIRGIDQSFLWCRTKCKVWRWLEASWRSPSTSVSTSLFPSVPSLTFQHRFFLTSTCSPGFRFIWQSSESKLQLSNILSTMAPMWMRGISAMCDSASKKTKLIMFFFLLFLCSFVIKAFIIIMQRQNIQSHILCCWTAYPRNVLFPHVCLGKNAASHCSEDQKSRLCQAPCQSRFSFRCQRPWRRMYHVRHLSILSISFDMFSPYYDVFL